MQGPSAIRGAVPQDSQRLLDFKDNEHKHADEQHAYDWPHPHPHPHPQDVQEVHEASGQSFVHLPASVLGEPAGPRLTDALGLEHATTVYLAEGTMAEVFEIVWKGDHEVMGSLSSGRMIMKMLKSSTAKSAKDREDFKKESELMLRLAHPNIVTVYGYGESPRPFIIMDFLSGGTVSSACEFAFERVGRARLTKRSVFPYTEVLQTGLDVAHALEYLHHHLPNSAAVIHRDLKPDNVTFDGNGTAKLIDFGVSVCVRKPALQNQVYRLTGKTGSLRYMAPEVAMNLPYNESVDVYSLGVILWEMGALTKPYQDMNSATFMQDIVSRGVRAPMPEHWPEEFRSVVASCWAPDWQQRPTAAALVIYLEALLQDATDMPEQEEATCCSIV